ncbi:MAG: hypothetical protein MTP17_01800 [Candidatus Midichloria sp.]|nr:MAG: hypothetical protein MTP17_01800 [Candidatus Midichloria sp.]
MMHALLFIFFILGFPSLKKDNFKEQAVVIDLVTVSEITNIKPRKQSTLQQQPKPAESAQEKPKQAVSGEAAQPSFVVKSEAAKAEETIKKQEVLEKKVLPQRKVTPQQPKITNELKKSAETKQELKSNVQDKKKGEYSKVLLKSLKATNKPQYHKKILDEKFQELEKIMEGKSDEPFNPDLEISMSEIDSIRNQIKRAWNPIAVNGSGQVMKVTIFMQLDKSGTIISVEPILESNHNPNYHAFVESVIRAIRKVSPLQDLTPNKFQAWKEMEMVFSSEEMIY